MGSVKEMKGSMSRYIYTTILVMFLLTTVDSLAEGVNSKDKIECNGIVSEFCTAWKKNQHERMFELLANTGSAVSGKQKFMNRFKRYSEKGGDLLKFTIENTLAEETFLIVSAKLAFSKDIEPRAVTGTHKFKVCNEKGEWKILYIIPPVKPPSPVNIHKNSHPQ